MYKYIVHLLNYLDILQHVVDTIAQARISVGKAKFRKIIIDLFNYWLNRHVEWASSYQPQLWKHCCNLNNDIVILASPNATQSTTATRISRQTDQQVFRGKQIDDAIAAERCTITTVTDATSVRKCGHDKETLYCSFCL